VIVDRVLALVVDGRLLEWVVVLMLIEGTVLLWWRRRTGGGLPASGVLCLLASGIFLMLAVRAALLDAGTEAVAVWLLAAFAAHIADLVVRWQRPSRGRAPRAAPPPGGSPQ
jgi:hypothetical protein